MESKRQKKLREDREILISALDKYRSINKVAKALNKSRSSVKSAAYALRKFGHVLEFIEDGNDYNKEVYEPSPEEIHKATLEIQKGWSKHDFYVKLRIDWRSTKVELESVDFMVHQKLSSSRGNE
jgi:biotin operon repressor|tara:strand:+ start:4141 stop:4515 length:375 start_codon:yes stop_codon:yes gene_type:complete